jgi:hypothetical protein
MVERVDADRTVNNGRGRSPSAGAVAERIAISTNASARRCVVVRSTPSPWSCNRNDSHSRSNSVVNTSPPTGSRTPSMATLPWNVTDADRCREACSVSASRSAAGQVGAQLPVLDALVGDPEERCPAHVDEELFNV